MTPKNLRFQEFACLVDVSFWQWVIHHKLNTWKLACPAIKLLAGLEPSPTGPARPILRLDSNSPQNEVNRGDDHSRKGHRLNNPDLQFYAEGLFFHVNTLEDFYCFPFTERVAETIGKTLELLGRSEPLGLKYDWPEYCQTVLNGFFLVAYMDLKRYSMTYVVSCPTLGFRSCITSASTCSFTRPIYTTVPQHSPATPPIPDSPARNRASSLPPTTSSPTDAASSSARANIDGLRKDKYVCTTPTIAAEREFGHTELSHIGRHLIDACCCHNSAIDRRSTASVCLVLRHRETGGLGFVSLSDIPSTITDLIGADDGQSIYLTFIDYSKSNSSLSWPSRNLLFTICRLASLYSSRLKLLAFRDLGLLSGMVSETQSGGGPSATLKSRVFNIHTPSMDAFSEQILLAGWLLIKRPEQHRANLRRFITQSIDPGRLPIPAAAVFTLNLQSFLDNRVVQQDATELNVKLIKWRIMPAFQPETIQSLRFLLIGMGTLGCSIARDLVGWGAMKFTLVDSGVVAPSNPARQSLYLARDVDAPTNTGSLCVRSNRKKVFIARDRLLEIRGDLQINALDWEIPMPSQERFLIPVEQFLGDTPEEGDILDDPSQTLSSGISYTRWIHDKLRTLVQGHDVILLLTDSRESRWLPALITQSISYGLALKNSEVTVNDRLGSPFQPPVCVTVALGFDTFVAIRHGTYTDSLLPTTLSLPDHMTNRTADTDRFFKPADTFRSRLSCYFCNDLTAPSSLGSRYRTLDQQCTVTRAGVAGFAASLTVELVASLSQAPFGFGAMPRCRKAELLQKLRNSRDLWPKQSASQVEALLNCQNHISCLGDCPHVTRGSVAGFSLASDWHPSFDQCVCCGAAVQQAYYLGGSTFVEQVIRDSGLLESTSGLSQLKEPENLKAVVEDIWVLEESDNEGSQMQQEDSDKSENQQQNVIVMNCRDW